MWPGGEGAGTGEESRGEEGGGGCQIVNIFVGHVAAQEKILHFSLGIINDVLKKPPKPPNENIAQEKKHTHTHARERSKIPTAAAHMNNCAGRDTHKHAHALIQKQEYSYTNIFVAACRQKVGFNYSGIGTKVQVKISSKCFKLKINYI